MTRPRLCSILFTGMLGKFLFRGGTMARLVNLRELKVGQKGRIAKVEAEGIVNQRIRDMGLIPGATVTVIGRAPLKDPVALRIAGVTISLRNSEADHIQVELPEKAGKKQPKSGN